MKWLAALLVFGLAVSVPAARADKHALLVGIDAYPDPARRLRGCLEDVQSVNRLLVEQLGYRQDEVVALLDGQATRQGIEDAFRRQLIERAGPGDEVFFYYSGHGSFIPDAGGEAADGLESTLCPYDADESRPAATLLTDHQLSALLAAVPTNRAVVVLDSCHSGNLTALEGIPPRNLREKYMSLGFDPADYNALPRRPRTGGGAEILCADAAAGGNPAHIILAACAADQAAYLDEPRGSVFTRSFVRAASGLNKETATYDDLFKALTVNLETSLREQGGKQRQTPRMKGLSAQLIKSSTADDAVAPQTPGGKPAHAAPAPPAYADFPLAVWPDKGTYRDGEAMRINVRAGKDCYLRLYHRDVNGKTQPIFPNAWQRDNRVKANQTVTVPGPGAGFEFTAQAPFGSEMIKAVASDRQFTDLEGVDWDKTPFVESTDDPHAYAATRTRGLKVQAARSTEPVPAANKTPEPALSEAETVVRIQPR